MLLYQTVKDLAFAVAAGNEVRGYSLVQKFGVNTAVGTTFVPVTDDGIYRTPQASGATALRVRAGNAADDAAGAGARSVRLFGLDENFAAAEEVIPTAGEAAGALSTTTWTRIYRVRVEESGTYATATAGSHVGDIVIETSGGEEWAEIPVNGFPHGTTEISVYSVAAGDIAYLQHVDIFTDAAKLTDVLLFARGNIDQTAPPYSPMFVIVDFLSEGGQQEHDLSHAPIKVVGPADIGFMAKVDVGTAVVAAGFELLIADRSIAV
jgi:hypothetical protein